MPRLQQLSFFLIAAGAITICWTDNVVAQNAICSSGASASSGCIAYEDADHEGDSQQLGPNRVFNYVGDNMNDEISSFAVADGCSVRVWEHRDKGGYSEDFGECVYVGDNWNDDVSSWACYCSN